jgi:hypothetical protein
VGKELQSDGEESLKNKDGFVQNANSPSQSKKELLRFLERNPGF